MSSDNQNGCLTVGEGVTLKGNFVVPDIASISGTIEGDLTGDFDWPNRGSQREYRC